MRFQRAQMPGAVVVVTGASSGIGRATAIAFARRGARVVPTARSAGALAQVARQCADAHPRAEAAWACEDVTDEGAPARVAHLAVVRFGRIDVWVNAAGIGVPGTIEQVPHADLLRVWDVNAGAAIRGARAALPYTRGQGQGVLINVSSVLGAVVQAPYMGAYAASKAALTGLGETLRQELTLTGARGVAVCTVLPAGVDTPFFTHMGNHTGRRLRALPPTATPESGPRASPSAAQCSASDSLVPDEVSSVSEEVVPMARWHRLIHATPHDVWSVLSDPRQYGRWVVGTHRSWPQGGGWPSEGAELGYALKAGPWTYHGRTVSRRCEPPHRLELEAKTGVGSARIAFRIEAWGEDTLVVVDEHPLAGPAAGWHNAAMDVLLRWRHRSMLARLDEAVESLAKAETRARA